MGEPASGWSAAFNRRRRSGSSCARRSSSPPDQLEDLLAYLARALVDHPEQVSVDAYEEEGALVLELSVAEDDVGKVIGRNGRTINALRTVVRASAVKVGRRVLVDVIE